MSEYQLIVIGSGPGGYVAAIRAAQYGLSVALIEERDVGGTCLNRGCIPTKALLHASSLLSAGKDEFENIGLEWAEPRVNWERLHLHKKEVVESLRNGVTSLVQGNKIDLLQGHGKILGSGRVLFTSAEGERELSAEHILIASGSEPDFPEIPGVDLPGVISSDDILEGIPEPLQSIAILGGGVIGVEFAAFYQDLGAHVELIVSSPRILRKMDKEIANTLASTLKRRGVKIRTNTSALEIQKSADGLTLRLDEKGRESLLTVDKVLVAKGRRPFMKGLLADGVQLEMNRRFIKVNEHFETSLPGVYAIGDVIGGLQLAHEASAEGEVAVAHMAHKEAEVNPGIVPSCIYTQPEIASVGPTEEELQEAGRSYTVGKYLMSGNSKSIIEGQGRGFIKFLFEGEDETLIAAHMICGRASDLISEFSTAIALGLSRRQLLSGMRPHPTYCEGIGEALAAAEGMSIHTMPRRR